MWASRADCEASRGSAVARQPAAAAGGGLRACERARAFVSRSGADGAAVAPWVLPALLLAQWRGSTSTFSRNRDSGAREVGLSAGGLGQSAR